MLKRKEVNEWYQGNLNIRYVVWFYRCAGSIFVLCVIIKKGILI